MLDRRTQPYTPFYCEENAWHLCQSDALGDGVARWVLFISNDHHTCALWHQRAAAPRAPIVWDYHVVVLSDDGDCWRVWDLDTRLELPMEAGAWLAWTFWGTAHVPAEFAPRFRMVPAAAFVAAFSSDRSHMRSPDGGWQHPPPPWPPILAPQRPMNLDAFKDTRSVFLGELHDLDSLTRRLARPGQETPP